MAHCGGRTKRPDNVTTKTKATTKPRICNGKGKVGGTRSTKLRQPQFILGLSSEMSIAVAVQFLLTRQKPLV